MRVLLINPWQAECFPPPALGYLQAVLKTVPEVTVKAADLYVALQQEDDWDIVAVTFHSFSVKYATGIRKSFKNGRLICGGHHVSAMPDQLLAAGYDQVVVGEGENAIIDIIKGNTNNIIQGAPVTLDGLPFPDYTGLQYDGTLGVPVISSRGCPYDCTFCASSDFWHRRWKMRSADDVCAEVAHHGSREFMFEDDNFTLNRQRALDVCAALAGRGLSWQCASRAETLVDDELCHALQAAGCHTVWLGVESLSQDTLDRCRKNTTVGKMLQGIATAERHGLQTMCQFIVGLPEDAQRDIDATVRNIRQSKIRRRGANILWVLPRTEAYNRAKLHGFDDATYLQSGAPFYTYEQSLLTLQQWTNQINTA
jgi:radical SAM superfamily enzyme YgiQ (UPF0313 family)